MNKCFVAGLAVIAASLVAVGAVHAGDMVKAKQRIEVSDTPQGVWDKFGDFCAIETWHPAVAKCELSESSDGDTLRTLTLADGGVILEKLVGQGDTETSYVYTILEGPLPVKDYVANFEVKIDDDGGAGIKWTAEFVADGVSNDEAQQLIEGIFAAGLDAVNSQY